MPWPTKKVLLAHAEFERAHTEYQRLCSRVRHLDERQIGASGVDSFLLSREEQVLTALMKRAFERFKPSSQKLRDSIDDAADEDE